jgi:hypothetical protein
VEGPRRFTRLRPVLAVVLPVLAISALALALRGRWSGQNPRASPQEAAGVSSGESARSGNVVDPMRFVQDRADTRKSSNLNELIQVYGHWVSRPDAVPARRAIVRTLLGHSSLPVGLGLLLTAVEADPTAREQDPMWSALVQNVASMWNPTTFSYGRDLLQIEDRPKAKDLLLESLTQVRPETLPRHQRRQLASDFIDMYAAVRPDQKPAVNRALHALAGSDVVEILAGRGLAAGDHQLKVSAERRRALEVIKRSRVPEAPPEP